MGQGVGHLVEGEHPLDVDLDRTVDAVLGQGYEVRRIGVLAVKPGPAHFGPLAQHCVDGEVTIHVERVFTLDEVPDALAHVGEGRALGKVVVGPSPRP